jgi:hypothetical protein
MLWNPVFSPDGSQILAKAEKNGKYLIVVNGRSTNRAYDRLWDPIISDDGQNVLLRFIEDGKYHRQVIPIGDLK